MTHRKKEFYPDYLLEILVTAFLITELAVLLALLYPEPVGRAIDFSLPFQPKPEWYFLWLYQLIGYFPGPWIVMGTTLLPALAFFALVLIPFIDREDVHSRRMAVAVGSVLLLGVLVLTLLAVIEH